MMAQVLLGPTIIRQRLSSKQGKFPRRDRRENWKRTLLCLPWSLWKESNRRTYGGVKLPKWMLTGSLLQCES